MRLRELFDDRLKHLKFNARLGKEFKDFLVEYQNKNDDHAEFFGGGYLGATKVNFTHTDYNTLYSILNASRQELDMGLNEVPTVNREFTVESDITNLVLLYVAYRFNTSESLSSTKRKEYAVTLLKIYLSRQYAILIADRFDFKVTKAISKQVYERLSKKFILRKKKSFRGVIEYKADSLYESPSYKIALNYYRHEKVKGLVGNLKNAVSSTMVIIYGVIMEVYSNSEGISSETIHATIESKMSVRDTINKLENNKDGILNKIATNSFMNTELMSIAIEVVRTLKKKNMQALIVYINTLSSTKDILLLTELVGNSLAYSYNYIFIKEEDNVTKALSALRGIYTSSSQDILLQQIQSDSRELIESSEIHIVDRQMPAVVAGLHIYLYLLSVA